MNGILRQTQPLSKLKLLTLALLALTFPVAAIPATAQTISTFDAPGAGTGINQGTLPFGINTAGA